MPVPLVFFLHIVWIVADWVADEEEEAITNRFKICEFRNKSKSGECDATHMLIPYHVGYAYWKNINKLFEKRQENGQKQTICRCNVENVYFRSYYDLLNFVVCINLQESKDVILGQAVSNIISMTLLPSEQVSFRRSVHVQRCNRNNKVKFHNFSGCN